MICPWYFKPKMKSMKTYNILIAALLFSIISCQKVELKEVTPDCIQQKIIEFENSSNSCESGKSVYRYKFQGQFVFVFNPGNCGADMMSDVYDQECNPLCGLGGIAGNIMCNGDNFSENATDETMIWEN